MKYLLIFIGFSFIFSLNVSANDVFIDTSRLKVQLESSLSKKSSSLSESTISLPLPNGSVVKLKFTKHSIVEKNTILSSTFKSWKVQGAEDPLIKGVIDISANGFHAMLLMPNGDTVFIDPQNISQDKYRTALKKLSPKGSDFKCLTKGLIDNSSSLLLNFEKRSARKKVTYRLALAATGAYTKFHTDAGRVAVDELMTMVARINTIYARDLGINLVLVANNSSIVFTPSNDPYTLNNIEDLAIQNKSVLNSKIGEANYDIGHVVTWFANDKSGVALLASTCKTASNNHKAIAGTGHSSPMGDTFTIDFLAHEMGHQLGATHTFNSTISSCGGARESATAYEPGSGSSIMAYAGICGSDNIATSSHAVFHIGSIEQIDKYVREEGGLACGSEVDSNNADPEITAITKNVVVRQGDSFTLTASAVDGDNDDLTYNWDQFDAGLPSTKNTDTGDNALYQITLPSSDPSRTFTGKATTDRDLTFKLVVRDGKGGIDSTITTVKVSATDIVATGSLEAVSANQERVASTTERGASSSSESSDDNGGGGGSYPISLLFLLSLLGLFSFSRKYDEK